MTRLFVSKTESDLTEAEAIQRAKDGDAAAFEYLYRANCRRVYNLCLRMIKNSAEAEDLTQQAFLQVFRKLGTFRGESGFATWLHTVTVNVVLMHLRRKKPAELLAGDLERRTPDGESQVENGPGDTSMLGAIERLNLMRAIRKLPSGYKRVFLLYDVIGYEHREIAGLLGCSTGSSKSQLHKARKRLQQLLQGEQGGAKPVSPPPGAEIRPAQELNRKRHRYVAPGVLHSNDFILRIHGFQARYRLGARRTDVFALRRS